jgi:type II secretory pathway component GspD/PulD (secretin)
MKQSLSSLVRTGLIASSLLVTASGWAQGFGGGFGGGSRRSTTTYPTSTSAGQAMFSYDSETRKVIAVTDEATAKNISMVVSNLDRPSPQVLIKVVFLEATYTHNLDLGIEGSFTKNMGNSMTGIVNQSFGLASSGANPVPPGAGIYQILGSDFQATLRAIAQAGKTEVLSRPSVLARNNQQASIQLAQQVPLVSGTRYDTLGNQINTISYTAVGIILQVTPFITSDGMVEMVVSPQVSELADKSQWVTTSSGPSGQILSPVINSRQADTVVIVPDGETAIIGGLMEKSKQQADSKIPVLGDIPLLGNLFKHRVSSDAKTELLIFLTPRIVKHPSQLAGLTSQERSGLLHMPKSMSEQDLDRFLDKVPTKEDGRGKK